MQPYTAYKDSGIPMLGEVPEHWEIRQLGRIGRFSKGGGGTKERYCQMLWIGVLA